jgi:hypothetical protein
MNRKETGALKKNKSITLAHDAFIKLIYTGWLI